ncbi:hypothetical protein NKH18_15780 [Streptomyces sp. M10(2022)]
MTGFSDPDAVQLLHDMLKIPSPSFAESELAAHVVDAMRGAGLTARIDEVGNAVGEIRRGPGPTVMLLGHLDTVPGTSRCGWSVIACTAGVRSTPRGRSPR